jgi:hypothetical protein
MSKDIEVGDVWEDEDMNIKLLIIYISRYNGSFDCLVHDMDNNIIYTKTFYFLNDCKYLGKSKGNIEDLFKTENEL